MAGSMTWNGAWGWAGTGHARTDAAARSGRAPSSGALQGPWVRGAAWGGRPVSQSSRGVARGHRATRGHVAHPVSRPRAGQRIGWRRLVSMAGDVLMVLTWAAMIPGMMWLGAAAGF